MKQFAISLLAIFLFGTACSTYAQDVWSGAGVNDNWSTDQNWADGSAPPNPFSAGALWWGIDGFGTNVMDQDWEVRYLIFTNNVGGSRHLVDLSGNTLTVRDYIQVGR